MALEEHVHNNVRALLILPKRTAMSAIPCTFESDIIGCLATLVFHETFVHCSLLLLSCSEFPFRVLRALLPLLRCLICLLLLDLVLCCIRLLDLEDAPRGA